MLTEDEVFEVVFDPGSDKREKWIPGPVFSSRRRHRRSAARKDMQRELDSTPLVYRRNSLWVKLSAWRESQSRKACGVDTPTLGRATTQCVSGRSGIG